jgi:hypothetical protein
MLLELLLRLEGDIRRRSEPIRVTLLQAGVLLFLRRHAEANVTDAAATYAGREATDSECGGQGPRAQALGHQASLG